MKSTIATFAGHEYVTSNRKPYKMCYTGDFIMKSLHAIINNTQTQEKI